MNLIGRMKFAAQTQSSLLCLWRNFAVAVELLPASTRPDMGETSPTLETESAHRPLCG